jgi:hypothetical protein
VRRFPIVLSAMATIVAMAGCGLGPGPGSGGVSLTVTRNFGTAPIGVVSRKHVTGAETVMRMLERSFHVQTRYGGGFVEAVNGQSGSGSQRDWFYYVNGIQASRGAAGTAVHSNDRIWFDLHDWRATDSVPAVVGSYPAPFTNGAGGRRYPTTIECAPDVQAACQQVAGALHRTGVPAASQLLGAASGTDTLGVVVATWPDVRAEVAGRYLEKGPGASGVYARFTGTGSGSLQLLTPSGHVGRTLGAGSGLIAATAGNASAPTWFITGTDAAGVAAAARQLTPAALHDHFALAVSGAQTIPVPVAPSS